MMTKEEFINRPGDVDLGLIFNDMRRRQREIYWPQYAQNCMMAQSQTPWMPYCEATISLMGSLFGKGF